MAQPDRIRLRDILGGALRSLPETGAFNRGAWNLLTTKRESTNSIGQVLARHAAKTPDAVALRFEDRQWTYGQFNAWANRLAHVFEAQGLREGDRVAILMENRPETLAMVAATVKLGAVAGMLNHNQRGEVLAHSLKLIEPKLLVCGEECREALASTPYVGVQDGVLRLWEGDSAPPEGFLDLRALAASAGEGDPPITETLKARTPCFYIFTTGTTGLPKASVMTHYRWLKGMAGLGQMSLRLQADDVFYCALPLYHNNALTVSWGSALGAGATLALARKFSASRFWDDIRQHNASAFCYIGELCRYLLNQPPRSTDRNHRVRLATGNGLRAEIWDAFQSRFGIAQINEFYGASEANVAFVNGFGLARTAGFCPLPYAVVEFDAEAEHARRNAKGLLSKVATGGVGLLISEVTEKNPFDGYTDRRASEAKLLRDVFKKGDVWFNTGDLVRDQGLRHIQFVDRVGDTFRWKGENVATTEVEAALNRFPGVEQAVVYGVELPGADGRAGMAALTLSGDFDGAALAEHLTKELPAYAVPLFIRLKPEQAVTGTFKFRKVELKQEGFDPARCPDPLHALMDRARGYQPLTPERFARIQQGALRF